MMNDKNLTLWEKMKAIPSEYLKEVTFGRKFTAIDPYYRLRMATKEWGPFGSKWGVRNEIFESEQFITGNASGEPIYQNEVLVHYTAELFYPEGTIPLHASEFLRSAKSKVDSDARKKVATDALTKGLSKLGFAADIFMGKFVDEKYVANDEEQKDELKEDGNDLNKRSRLRRMLRYISEKSGIKDVTVWKAVTAGLELPNNTTMRNVDDAKMDTIVFNAECYADEKKVDITGV